MHLGQQVLFPCSVKMGCNESHSTIPRLATIFLWAASVTFPCFVNGGKWFRKTIYNSRFEKNIYYVKSIKYIYLELKKNRASKTAIS